MNKQIDFYIFILKIPTSDSSTLWTSNFFFSFSHFRIQYENEKSFCLFFIFHPAISFTTWISSLIIYMYHFITNNSFGKTKDWSHASFSFASSVFVQQYGCFFCLRMICIVIININKKLCIQKNFHIIHENEI